MSETVYLSFSKNTQVHNQKVRIGQAASIWCSDNHIAARIKAMTLVNVPDVKSRRYVFSVMKVVELIKKEFDNVEINNMGESEFVVSYKQQEKPHLIWRIMKVIFVAAIVFCGGAFAIMAYGNDVDINSILSAICDFTTGDVKWLFALQIAYCVGLGAGIIIFYNHLGSRRYEKDPTPLEVEMRLYEDDLNTAIINNSAREGKEEDVD